MTRFRYAAAAMMLMLAVPTVGSAQNREHLQLTADLRVLQEQMARIQVTQNQLLDLLKTTNKRLDDVAAANLKSSADIQLLIKDVSSSIATLREKLDANTVQVQRVGQELPGIREGLSMLVTQVNALVGLLQPSVANPGAPVGSSAVNVPESPSRMFDLARADYNSNRLDNAIQGFTEFIQKYPTAAQAAEAQYYVGDAYYYQRKYSEAIEAYKKVIDNYKDSDHVPDAYYQQALSLEALRKQAEANRIYEFVVKTYPETSAGYRAKQQLLAPAAR